MTEADHVENRQDTELADRLEQLLARIALKDQQALQTLYRLVSGKLNGIAMKLLNDADMSNDVLQETLLQIWHNAGEYRRHQGEPMTWMTSLLRYRALDKLRAETRERKRRDQYEEVQTLFGESEAEGVASRAKPLLGEDQRLNHCLDSLDVLNRNAILMAYYYGFSREDIAIHVAQPLNTVKSWLKRGLTRLAQCLGH